MKHKTFLPLLENILQTFSGIRDKTAEICLESNDKSLTYETVAKIGNIVELILLVKKIDVTDKLLHKIFVSFASLIASFETENSKIFGVIAESNFKLGLKRLKDIEDIEEEEEIVKKIELALEKFYDAREIYLDLIKKDKTTNSFTILIRNLNPINSNYYREIANIFTNAFVACIFEAYCCKLLDNNHRLKIRLEDSQLLFYLRLFYLENSLRIEEVKNKIDSKYLEYTIESYEREAGNIYSEIKEEEKVFINLLEKIFDYKVPKILDNQPYIERSESRHPSSGVVDIRSRTSFNLMPNIFKTDQILKKCWARNLENDRNK